VRSREPLRAGAPAPALHPSRDEPSPRGRRRRVRAARRPPRECTVLCCARGRGHPPRDGLVAPLRDETLLLLQRGERAALDRPVAQEDRASRRRVQLRDAACPLSTRGGTRLVRLVRGRGRGGGGTRPRRLAELPAVLTRRRVGRPPRPAAGPARRAKRPPRDARLPARRLLCLRLRRRAAPRARRRAARGAARGGGRDGAAPPRARPRAVLLQHLSGPRAVLLQHLSGLRARAVWQDPARAARGARGGPGRRAEVVAEPEARVVEVRGLGARDEVRYLPAGAGGRETGSGAGQARVRVRLRGAAPVGGVRGRARRLCASRRPSP
jgi:hypothetical protein